MQITTATFYQNRTKLSIYSMCHVPTLVKRKKVDTNVYLNILGVSSDFQS
jgi:hypothetical protein